MQAPDLDRQTTATERVDTVQITSTKITTLAIALVSLCLVVGAARYFGASTGDTERRASIRTQRTTENPSAARQGVVVPAVPAHFAGGLAPGEAPPRDAFSSNPPRSAAESHVLRVVQADAPDSAKVEQLLAVLPNVPEDAQLLAMEQATELIPDAAYLRYRERLFELAHSEALREAVIDDALTRGEEVRLPSLVEMLRTPITSRERTQIREILVAYLDEDFGSDPRQWEAPVRHWVAANSDG